MGGAASKLGHYYNEEKTACRGMCAREGGHSLGQAPMYAAGYVKKFILSLL